MNPNEKELTELKEAIAAELELCRHNDTPTVCSMKNTPEGYAKIEARIIDMVGNGGRTISEAIISIEKEYNPNILD